MQKIIPGTHHPLHGLDQTRYIEQSAIHSLPPNTLMQRAGLAVARMALALAPHAQRIWIACGPGNNGGDGLEAARHLQQWGKQPVVTWLGHPTSAPADTLLTYHRLQDAGIPIRPAPGDDFDFCIDALLGMGGQLREPTGQMADWIRLLNDSRVPVLSVDLPTGLHADTGQTTTQHVKASHTLCLLTLKPGVFTAHGRDAAGQVWLDALELEPGVLTEFAPTAYLNAQPARKERLHATHKGSYGDVAVIGGASGMTGAALLAASAALHAGAGRVFVGLLDDNALAADVLQPELMFRPVKAWNLSTMTVVCGCGGGQFVRTVLGDVLSSEAPVVLDADALNEIAISDQLQTALAARSARQTTTVLTPHPLEAARLLATTAQKVQADRLSATQILVQRFGCTVILKGSGSIIASPQQVPVINPTGNARLSSAGTGDVLAGMVGAQLAAGMTVFEAACRAVYLHGALADTWPPHATLTAQQLAQGRAGLADA